MLQSSSELFYSLNRAVITSSYLYTENVANQEHINTNSNSIIYELINNVGALQTGLSTITSNLLASSNVFQQSLCNAGTLCNQVSALATNYAVVTNNLNALNINVGNLNRVTNTLSNILFVALSNLGTISWAAASSTSGAAFADKLFTVFNPNSTLVPTLKFIAKQGARVQVSTEGVITGIVGGSLVYDLTACVANLNSQSGLTFTNTPLPGGISLSSTGILTITPLIASTSSATLTVTNGYGNTSTAPLHFKIAPTSFSIYVDPLTAQTVSPATIIQLDTSLSQTNVPYLVTQRGGMVNNSSIPYNVSVQAQWIQTAQAPNDTTFKWYVQTSSSVSTNTTGSTSVLVAPGDTLQIVADSSTTLYTPDFGLSGGNHTFYITASYITS